MSALSTSIPSRWTSAWHVAGIATLTAIRNTSVETPRAGSPSTATRTASTAPVSTASTKLNAIIRGVWKNAM